MTRQKNEDMKPVRLKVRSPSLRAGLKMIKLRRRSIMTVDDGGGTPKATAIVRPLPSDDEVEEGKQPLAGRILNYKNQPIWGSH